MHQDSGELAQFFTYPPVSADALLNQQYVREIEEKKKEEGFFQEKRRGEGGGEEMEMARVPGSPDRPAIVSSSAPLLASSAFGLFAISIVLLVRRARVKGKEEGLRGGKKRKKGEEGESLCGVRFGSILSASFFCPFRSVAGCASFVFEKSQLERRKGRGKGGVGQTHYVMSQTVISFCLWRNCQRGGRGGGEGKRNSASVSSFSGEFLLASLRASRPPSRQKGKLSRR